MTIFHLLKIRMSKDIFKNEKCKVTFGLEYIIIQEMLISIFYCFLYTLNNFPDFT